MLALQVPPRRGALICGRLNVLWQVSLQVKSAASHAILPWLAALQPLAAARPAPHMLSLRGRPSYVFRGLKHTIELLQDRKVFAISERQVRRPSHLSRPFRKQRVAAHK